MREAVGNLWELPADARCITTNGTVKSNGELVMGAGNALEAKRLYTDMAARLGACVLKYGNHVAVGSRSPLVLTFPTKKHYRDMSDLSLIVRSAVELEEFLDSNSAERLGIILDTVLLPRPGCGLGKLDWDTQVRPLLASILSDRVVAISPNININPVREPHAG